jgi:hypothetical protein
MASLRAEPGGAHGSVRNSCSRQSATALLRTILHVSIVRVSPNIQAGQVLHERVQAQSTSMIVVDLIEYPTGKERYRNGLAKGVTQDDIRCWRA